ncbi:transposable element Tcb2 transposase [Trichonephila clavipes]|nr:transposable element Tcb2 transposase [Trichonephila clavipes]
MKVERLRDKYHIKMKTAVRNIGAKFSRSKHSYMQFKRNDKIRAETLPWPARSPDLSPVEHVWDQLRRQTPSCHSVHDLELAVQDLWVHLPQDNIRCLINSMSDREAACIAAGGGPTRY